MENTQKDDPRIHVPEDVRIALEKYAGAEKKRMKNPIIADMITWRSLANHILLNEVQKRGYYVGKAKP